MGTFSDDIFSVAALFVHRNGVYYEVPGVDPWDEARDARLYAGPYPVVAHPPCARWGRYWHGNGRGHRYEKGDDNGCFLAAVQAVQRWGGILEHPEASSAFYAHRIPHPQPGQQWQPVGYAAAGIAWVVEVEQGHYGHPAPKRTWLYAVGSRPADVMLGKSKPERGRRNSLVEKMSRRQRAATPPEFRDYLIEYARNCRK